MRWLDLGVIAAYLAGITWFGSRFRSSQKSLKDYFLGGKNAPWWAIALSIVSAETSTLTVSRHTFHRLPREFLLAFLQLVMGYLLARIVIAALFLPAYFRGEMYTAYELMRIRFGTRIRRWTAGTFLVLRALAEGVRVFAISIVVAIVLQTGEMTSIAVIIALTLVYTHEGGLTAVIWTDVIQMFLYVLGAGASLFAILHQIPGGWSHVVELARPLGKFQVFDFAIGPGFFSKSYSFWAGILGGCFLTTASHGTEQLMVQRLLAARDEKESRKALLVSWVVIFALFTLFLTIGVCLFTLYHDAGRPTPKVTDTIYPDFVWHELPVGIAGLVTAAILAAAMSNLSAALNSLSSTTVMDFIRPLAKSPATEATWLARARWATLAWGAILFGVALIARNWGGVLQAGLSIASILYGGLLGVFLLGLLTKRVGETAAICGMMASFTLMLYIRFFTSIAFTWYVIIGTAATCAVALVVSLFLQEELPRAIE